MPPKKRTDRETWEAIEAQARAEEIARFVAMPSSQVDARLRAAGHDPAALRAEGTALAKKLLADRDRLAWQVEAAEGLAREQARFAERPARYAGLSASELHERIAVARKNPRLAQPVAVMFRNKKAEEASEDELRAILEELDALAEKPESDE
jgi:hypothetical protein